jgi:hypothetical protein
MTQRLMQDARHVHQPPRSRVVRAGLARPVINPSPFRARAAQVTGVAAHHCAEYTDQAAETRATPFSLAVEACGCG